MTLISEVIGDLVATARFIISILWIPVVLVGGAAFFVNYITGWRLFW